MLFVQVAKLHEMLRPYLLRRVKEDVEKSLPPKASRLFFFSFETRYRVNVLRYSICEDVIGSMAA